MGFPILLNDASIHYWKDSYVMPLSSVVTALLEVFNASKTTSLDDPFELGEKKKTQKMRLRE